MRIQNTRDLGLVSGLGTQNQPLLLQHIRKRVMEELSYGDVVVTSGENDNYMRDIPVGTITKITALDYNSSLNIELTPITDFLAIEGNKVVFRPDSGEPVATTIDCLNILEKGFGSYLTDKGYKVFDSNIGLLWGDGLNYHKIRDILFAMKSNGWAAENIIFGMGGGLHTSVNRDTQRNAFKCSAQLRNGKWIDIYKNPLDSSKKSKTGRFKLINENNFFKTTPSKNFFLS